MKRLFTPLRAVLLTVIFVQLGLILWMESRPPAKPVVNEADQIADYRKSFVTGSHQLGLELIESNHEYGSGGAIAFVGERLILASRLGEFSVAKGKAFEALALPSPVNIEELQVHFSSDQGKRSVGVKDMVIRSDGERSDIFVAHSGISTASDGSLCYQLKVSVLSTVWEAGEFVGADDSWRQIFGIQPCLPVDADIMLVQSGGMLEFGPDGKLLLTVGDHGFDYIHHEADGADPQDPNSDFGKVISIDIDNGSSEVFSIGHRNNAGMAVLRNGQIWATEHGPRGGDELNLVESGENYGWPIQTYGSRYVEFDWPTNPSEAQHDLYRRPVMAWVPSIGASELIEINGAQQFPQWDGDILMATLRAEALFRLRIREGRVVISERINIGGRVRDLAQSPDGAIYLLMDTLNYVAVLKDETLDSGQDLPEGMAFCGNCHQIDESIADVGYAGPTLVGVVGREIASVPGYNYSPALRALDGIWTPDLLMAYIRSPSGVVPGTSMPSLEIEFNDALHVVETLERNSE